MIQKCFGCLLIGTIALLLACAPSPAPASALAPLAKDAGPATILVQPFQGSSATKLTIYGAGFAPGEKVRIMLTYQGVTNILAAVETGGFVVANEQGAFKLVPAGGIPAVEVIGPGVYTLEAVGEKGSRATAPLEVVEKPKK